MQTILKSKPLQKMLIVDDNGDLRKLLRLTFGYGKYQIMEADNGQAALNIAMQEKPDLILLDIMMPGEIDGLRVCELIKSSENLKDCCVIMLTARGQREDFEKGARAGADFYITKPFSPLELIEIIERKRFERTA